MQLLVRTTPPGVIAMKRLSAVFYTSPEIPLLMVAALLFANMSVAEPIYKSTNAQGEVVFSDEPPPNAVNVEQVEIQPAPTGAEHRESAERTRRMESMADEMGTARRERAAQPVQAAPETVDEQPDQTYVDGDYNQEQRRRRAIAGERGPGVEHRAPAVPHAGGGIRR